MTGVATTTAEALASGRGVCQDAAHVMIALCRAAGLPARYVSGHLLGEGGTHAWVEVIVADAADARAVAYDPSSGRRAGRDYLTVATGRDYADVAPTSGTYVGGARGTLTATKRVGIALADPRVLAEPRVPLTRRPPMGRAESGRGLAVPGECTLASFLELRDRTAHA